MYCDTRQSDVNKTLASEQDAFFVWFFSWDVWSQCDGWYACLLRVLDAKLWYLLLLLFHYTLQGGQAYAFSLLHQNNQQEDAPH